MEISNTAALGTFNHLAAWYSEVSQKPPHVKSYVTYKI
jgi:hypothetical protein